MKTVLLGVGMLISGTIGFVLFYITGLSWSIITWFFAAFAVIGFITAIVGEVKDD